MNAFTAREAIREAKTRVNKIKDTSIKEMLLNELEVITDGMDDRSIDINVAYNEARDIGERAHFTIKDEEWNALTDEERAEAIDKKKRSKAAIERLSTIMGGVNGPYGCLDRVIDFMKDGKK